MRTKKIIPKFTKPEIDYIIKNQTLPSRNYSFSTCGTKNALRNIVPRKYQHDNSKKFQKEP